MEIRQLRSFLAVLEEGSLHGAARRLFVGQPAITRQLQALERSLGVELFERGPGGSSATPAGEAFAAHARQILGSVDALLDPAGHEADRFRGRLVIGVPEEGLCELTPVVVAAYRATFPNVDLNLISCDLTALSNLAAGCGDQFDVLLWLANEEDESSAELEAVPVYSEPLRAVVPARSEMADADVLDPVTLLEHPFINAGQHVYDFASVLTLAQHRNGAATRLTTQVYSQTDAVFDAVARGEGLMCATPGSRRILDDGAGVAFVELDGDPRTSTGVIMRRGEDREHVRSFAAIASSVGASLSSLVPDAVIDQSAIPDSEAMPNRHYRDDRQLAKLHPWQQLTE